MCLEIFSKEVPIKIRFGFEEIRFRGAQKVEIRYAFLLTNAGDTPISRLIALYPRNLLEVPSPPTARVADLFNGRIEDITPDLPTHVAGLDNSRDGFLFLAPKAGGNAAAIHEPLIGRWGKQTVEWGFPSHFSADHVSLMRTAGLTAWLAALDEPIEPANSQWFYWKVQVDQIGLDEPITILGCRTIFHTVVSPADIRRVFKQHFRSLKEASIQQGIAVGAECYGDILERFGLEDRRDVDIQYYELAICPGHPWQRFVLSWQTEREIQVLDSALGIPRKSASGLVYEWKTGSSLFAIHFVIAYERSSDNDTLDQD
jgi:hypothetical protein